LDEVSGILAESGSKCTREFRVKRRSGSAGFRADFLVEPMPYRLGVDNSGINSVVVVERVDGGTAQAVSSSYVEVSDVSFAPRTDQPSRYDFRFRLAFPADKLGAPGAICRMNVKLAPSAASFRMPDWINEWDMRTERIPQWAQHPETFDAGSTLNLKSFVTNVAHATISEHRPGLAEFNAYFRVE